MWIKPLANPRTLRHTVGHRLRALGLPAPFLRGDRVHEDLCCLRGDGVTPEAMTYVPILCSLCSLRLTPLPLLLSVFAAPRDSLLSPLWARKTLPEAQSFREGLWLELILNRRQIQDGRVQRLAV